MFLQIAEMQQKTIRMKNENESRNKWRRNIDRKCGYQEEPNAANRRTVAQKSHESRHKYWVTHLSVRQLACTAHSFPCSTLLASLACSTALICSLARSLTDSQAHKKVNDYMSQNWAVLNHSAASPLRIIIGTRNVIIRSESQGSDEFWRGYTMNIEPRTCEIVNWVQNFV